MGGVRIAFVAAAVALALMVAAGQVPVRHHLVLGAIVAGAVMTQPFGCTDLEVEPADSACPGGHFHSGIDLAAPAGTDVRAAIGGMALVGFDSGGAGLYVVVLTDARAQALYCHLSAASVAGGEHVTAGQVIGQVGATGLTTGAHLHFEVQVDHRPVDPATWLAPIA